MPGLSSDMVLSKRNGSESDKSDAILIGTAQRAHSYSNLTSVNVAGTTIPLASNNSASLRPLSARDAVIR